MIELHKLVQNLKKNKIIKKVGLVKYGSDKEKWLKDVDQER